MNTRDTTETVAEAGTVLRIRGGKGAVLAPKSGVLWVSDPSSANDAMVLPGDSYRIAGGGPVTVVAHGAARFALKLPPEPEAGCTVELALSGETPQPRLRVITAPGLAPAQWAASVGAPRVAAGGARTARMI